MDSETTPVPLVSVVMAVFNGAAHLAVTMDSILNQRLSDFEFIIVDDGSTDDTAVILQTYAVRDRRIRLVRQDNSGLTKSLISGCRLARGAIIARQDVGDQSLPDRLQKQVEALSRDPDCVAVGPGARRIGPRGEFLGNLTRCLEPAAVTRQLIESGVGLLHAGSVFRRAAYESAGGYREEFRCAQDTDLWYRLSEIGLLAECPEILFEVRAELTGISGQQIERQIRLAELARQCYEARRSGLSEDQLLEKARRVSAAAMTTSTKDDVKRRTAEAAYFIGSQLYSLRDRRCRTYLGQALAAGRRFFPAMFKYLASFAVCLR